jgi:hypothetical protein
MKTDRASGLLLALFAAWVIWESRGLPFGTFRQPGPAYMPVVLASILLVSAILIAAAGGGSKPLAAVGWVEWRHALAILASCAFAALALERIGYRFTVVIVLLFILKALERRGWVSSLGFALTMAFGSFYLFHTLLRVPLPLGPWGI